MAWGNGGGKIVEGEPEVARLRFELMRLRGRLEVREAELHRLTALADLQTRDAKLPDASPRAPQQAQAPEQGQGQAQGQTQGHGQEGQEGLGDEGTHAKTSSAVKTGAEEEVSALRGQVGRLQKELRASEEEVRRLQAAAAQADFSAASEEAARELRREAQRTVADNVQLRQRVEELQSEKAKYSAKSRSMDAKIMHAAAEAELTRMEKEVVGKGWSTGVLLLSSAAAAVAAGMLVSWAKRSSST